MFTYDKELARRGWHRSGAVRTGLVLAGVVLLFVGWIMWSLEQETGGWEGTDLGHHVISTDASGQTVVSTEDGSVHEFDSHEEAEAWIENQRERDFTGSIVVMVAGGLLVAAGVAPSPKRRW